MPFENILAQLQTSFDRYVIDQALLLLLPKQRYAPSYLDHTIQPVIIGYNQLRLNVVGHIGVIVYSSGDKSGPRPQLSSPGNEHDLKLFTLKFQLFLFYIPLDDW